MWGFDASDAGKLPPIFAPGFFLFCAFEQAYFCPLLATPRKLG
jgi:hypothetical protein